MLRFRGVMLLLPPFWPLFFAVGLGITLARVIPLLLAVTVFLFVLFFQHSGYQREKGWLATPAAPKKNAEHVFCQRGSYRVTRASDGNPIVKNWRYPPTVALI